MAFFAVFSLGDDLPPLVRFENRAQARADYFVIVRDQNPSHDPLPHPASPVLLVDRWLEQRGEHVTAERRQLETAGALVAVNEFAN
jgi:hypothetical protein